MELKNILKISKLSKGTTLVGYSLHHLHTEEKDNCISRISDLLLESGLFVFYDVLSKEDETEKECNSRACKVFESGWNKLEKDELNDLVSHVMENDHPENEKFYLKTFMKNGLTNIEKAFQSENELYALYFVKKRAKRGLLTRRRWLS